MLSAIKINRKSLARKTGKKCRQELPKYGQAQIKKFPLPDSGEGQNPLKHWYIPLGTTFSGPSAMKITAFFYELGDQTRPKSYSPLIFQQRIVWVFYEFDERFFCWKLKLLGFDVPSGHHQNRFWFGCLWFPPAESCRSSWIKRSSNSSKTLPIFCWKISGEQYLGRVWSPNS